MKGDKKSEQLQQIVFDYFKDVDDDTILSITHSFTFIKPADNNKVSELITKFLKDNGLERAYVNYLSDFNDPDKLFFRSSMAEADIIQKIKIAFLVMSFNRSYKRVANNNKEDNELKKNFKFVKKQCLSMYECMNRNENYFDGKEEDAKMVEKIENMK